jgi:hypothetical protein
MMVKTLEIGTKYSENPTTDSMLKIVNVSDFEYAELDDNTVAAYKLEKYISGVWFKGFIHIREDLLAKELKCSERTVYAAIEQLLEKKHLFRAFERSRFWINLLKYGKR